MFSHEILAHIFGFLGMMVAIVAYLQKDDITVKKLMILSPFFWGVHFYFLGVYAGLVTSVIWLVRMGLSYKYEQNFKAFLFIILLCFMAGYYTYDGVISLFPIISSMIGAYAYFYLRAIKLRIAMVINSLFWLSYHIYINSMSGIINEGIAQVMLMLTIYRMLHPEGGSHYYTQKIKDILWKTSRPDYDRFVFIHDRLRHYRKQTGNNFHKILHLDLKASLLKKKWTLCKEFLKSQKEESLLDSTLGALHLKK